PRRRRTSRRARRLPPSAPAAPRGPAHTWRAAPGSAPRDRDRDWRTPRDTPPDGPPECGWRLRQPARERDRHATGPAAAVRLPQGAADLGAPGTTPGRPARRTPGAATRFRFPAPPDSTTAYRARRSRSAA